MKLASIIKKVQQAFLLFCRGLEVLLITIVLRPALSPRLSASQSAITPTPFSSPVLSSSLLNQGVYFQCYLKPVFCIPPQQPPHLVITYETIHCEQ